MLSRLSMLNLPAALIFSAACGFGASVGVTTIRQPGASLDTSLRNEREHAVDLAAEWLAARQGTDGCWGSETDRVERTSVALLALTARRSRHSDAVARAAVWLDAYPPAAGESGEAGAWRMLALLSVAPDTPDRAGLARRLLRETPPPAADAATSFFSRLLWAEALALGGAEVEPRLAAPAERTLAALAAEWPPDTRAPASLWLMAFLINRTSGGRLESGGAPLDWRRDIAQTLLGDQRRDPAGGGFWFSAESDARIRQTAFGILALNEL